MNTEQLVQKPDIKLSVKQTFGFDSEMKVGAFSKKNELTYSIASIPKFIFDIFAKSRWSNSPEYRERCSDHCAKDISKSMGFGLQEISFGTDNPPVDEHVHKVRPDVIEQALVVRDH